MSDQLVFNDSLGVLTGGIQTGLTSLTGTVNIAYDTGVVTGSLTVAAAGTLGAQTYTNLTVTQTGTDTDGITPIYTLTGTNSVTNISIVYTGALPTTMTADVYTNALPGVAIFNGNGNVASTVVCFAAGTLIRTTRGDVAVEALAVGDIAVTTSGEHRTIRWLGHRLTDCRNHPRPELVMPVCISAHALGPNKPTRDLYLSPGHSICIDMLGEVLIPATCLVNGSTIKQVEVEEVSYWHVELEGHDILLANGLPAESYIEMSNRSFFGLDNVIGLNNLPDVPGRSHADFCRPFHDSGPVVEAVRAQLRARSRGLGWTLDDAPFADLHLVVDGQRLDPEVSGLSARFVVSALAQSVWLHSDASVPERTGYSADTRLLGVCISGLTIDDGLEGRRVVEPNDPNLCVGFNDCEEGIRRWTTGRALVPANLWDNCRGQFFLRVDLAVPALPRWVEPVRETMAPNNDGIRLVRSA